MKLEAAKGWVNTGYKPGAQNDAYVVIRAEGEWCVRTDDRPYGTRNAAGGRDTTSAVYYERCEGDTKYPYHGPRALMGQLIGKLGEHGKTFIVGQFCKLVVKDCSSSDQLWLRANFPDTKTSDGSLDVTFTLSDGGSDTPNERWDRIAQRYVPC